MHLGRTIFILVLLTFFAISLGTGVKFEMRIAGLSPTTSGYVFQSTHETLTRLMIKADTLALSCPSQKNVCVRPIDYSHLRPYMPVRMELCNSQDKFPKCDDVKLGFVVNTRNLLLTGFLR